MGQLGWIYFPAAAGGDFSGTWSADLFNRDGSGVTVGGNASLTIYAQQSIGMTITGAPFTQSTSTQTVNGASETVDEWTISVSGSNSFPVGVRGFFSLASESFTVDTTSLSGTVGILVEATLTQFDDRGIETADEQSIRSEFDSNIRRLAGDYYDEVESSSQPRYQNSANGTIRWGDLTTIFR